MGLAPFAVPLQTLAAVHGRGQVKRGETRGWVEGCPIFMGFAEQINFSDERFLTVLEFALP